MRNAHRIIDTDKAKVCCTLSSLGNAGAGAREVSKNAPLACKPLWHVLDAPAIAKCHASVTFATTIQIEQCCAMLVAARWQRLQAI